MLHHKDDRKWLESQINRLPERLIPVAVQGYEKAYKEAWANAKTNPEREGDARRAANTRLRHYIAKVLNEPVQ